MNIAEAKSTILSTLMLFVLLFGFTTLVGAEAVVNVTPFEDLSTVNPTAVTVNMNGLAPNEEVQIRQVSMAPFSEAEGDVGTGVKVEQLHKGTVTTDDNGQAVAVVSVQYDVRTDLDNMNYCDEEYSQRKLCYLQIQYGGDSELSGEVIDQFKLYFGRTAPNNGGGSGDPEEPPTVSLSKEACMKNGWQNFAEQYGFKNQGACASFVSNSQNRALTN